MTPDERIEALTETSHFATKRDIAELRAELDFLKWMIGIEYRAGMSNKKHLSHRIKFRQHDLYDNQLLMTIAQTITTLQVSRDTLRRWATTGKLVPLTRSNPQEKILYLRSDVMNLIEKLSPPLKARETHLDRLNKNVMCPDCSRWFKNDFGLRIHSGSQHKPRKAVVNHDNSNQEADAQ